MTQAYTRRDRNSLESVAPRQNAQDLDKENTKTNTAVNCTFIFFLNMHACVVDYMCSDTCSVAN